MNHQTIFFEKEKEITKSYEEEMENRKKMLKQVMFNCKIRLDCYQTGYEIKISDNMLGFVNHQTKTVWLENISIFDINIPETIYFEKKIFNIIGEIYFYQNYLELYGYLYEENVSWEVVKTIKGVLENINFHIGVSSVNRKGLEQQFITKYLKVDYENLMGKEKIKEHHDVEKYEEIVRKVIKKSGLNPQVEYVYKKTENPEMLGCYRSEINKNDLEEDAIKREKETIVINMLNIIESFEKKENVHFLSIEEAIEAVTAHEIGHMIRKKSKLADRKIRTEDKMEKAVKEKNKELFLTLFVQYFELTLREEKRAWVESHHYLFTEQYKKNIKKYIKETLKIYGINLRMKKKKWLNEIRMVNQ